MSRFLQQMKYEPSQEPEFTNLSFEISNPAFCATTIERTNLHNLKILSRFSGDNEHNKLSPSAINTWLNCRMRFYYRYVNDLKEPEKISEEIDPAMLGTLLHESMRNLYSGFIDKEVDTNRVNEILKDKDKLNKLIIRVIKEKFRRNHDSVIAVNELIVRNVLLKYISRVLEIDRKIAPFTILALEKPVRFRLSSLKDLGDKGIIIGGTIDRVDIKDGITRIVDYKTGTTSDYVTSIDILFKDDREKEADGWLQTMIYCEGYLDLKQNARVRPSVYKIKKNPGEEALDKLLLKTSKKEGIPVDEYSTVRNEFMEGLEALVKTILSKDEPFIMTVDKRNKCSYCPYRILCMR
jgi:CRISPR/Cas system-associated exonuclease Cas4 (RecB family)